MKTLTFLATILVIGFCTIKAENNQLSIAVGYSQQTVEFNPQPQNSNSTVLPLIQAKTTGGDFYGIGFQGSDGGSPFIEILDVSGKALKTITVNDILGKGVSGGVKLLSSVVAGSANWSENVYDISSAQGKFHLLINALATAASSTKEAPAKLIVKFVLKNAPAGVAGARIVLPFTGNSEMKANGFAIGGLKSSHMFTAGIFPQPEKISIVDKSVSFTTKSVKTNNEIILGMLTIDGASSKTEAMAQLQAAEKGSGSDVAIVTTSDKGAAQPADTITYRIVCSNIGKSSVSNIVITNPISQGIRYIEGSATGDDTQITFDRAKVPAPQLGSVNVIKWKLLNSLKTGDERVVSFKVIVE